jgi:two-component system OmpR family sensor kinase
MVDESDRLVRLVNDLLLLARADAGRSLAKEPLEIQPVLEETVRQAHQLDENRQITLDAVPDISILGVRDAFKQVMLILLDNALKHSDGDVNVEISRNNAQANIRVQDHGSGIAPDKIGHIFDRFYRGKDNKPITPGFGLGLPIAKSLVEGMDGTIAIESILNQGSIVILRFPSAK